MLIWLWLTSVALLFGAEVNAASRRLADERGPGRLEDGRLPERRRGPVATTDRD